MGSGAGHLGRARGASARIAVVLPDPAGPSPAVSSVLPGGETGDQMTLPRVETASGERLVSVQCGGYRRAGQPCGRGHGRSGEQPLFGVENGLAGVPLGRMLGEH